MANFPITSFLVWAKNKATGACEQVELPNISTDVGNAIVADANGDLFAPAGGSTSSISGSAGGVYTHNDGAGNPFDIEALDNTNGTAEVLGCTVSTEQTRIDCNNVDGDAIGLVHRSIDLKTNVTTSREWFVMPQVGQLAGNASLSYGVADDITNIDEIIGQFTVNTPCDYDMSLYGYYHIRGANDADQFVGNVQHSLQADVNAGPIIGVSFTNVFNNENNNPAAGTTGADPTENEAQVPVAGLIPLTAGTNVVRVRISISSASNIVEAGEINFNQFRLTYTLPSKICCVNVQMYSVAAVDVTPEKLTEIIGNERAVILPVGEFVMDSPILLPDDLRSDHWAQLGGGTWNVKGSGQSLTRLKQTHNDWLIKQVHADEDGVRNAPHISDLTLSGNPLSNGGIWAKGWRKGSIERVAFDSFPDGVGVLIDGRTFGGSWYNKVHDCVFGTNVSSHNPEVIDPKLEWIKVGVKLAGKSDDRGKTNECMISDSSFQNCTFAGIEQTGFGELDPEQRGVNGGSAFNRSYNNTFYARQALFYEFLPNRKPRFRPRGIHHDSNGGLLSIGDYFEDLYYGVTQSNNVTDDKFEIAHALMKKTGRIQVLHPSGQTDGVNRDDYEYLTIYDVVRYGETYSNRFKGKLGFNIWRNKDIESGNIIIQVTQYA